MKTLNYGSIPADLSIDRPYRLDLNKTDLESVARIVNQGIDSHLEAVFTKQIGRTVWIQDSASMKTFLRRCMESDDENAQDLASCIMETLGYEWV
jgi:hypothetical protein